MEFHAYENFMAYGRKFFGIREEENFLAGRNFILPDTCFNSPGERGCDYLEKRENGRGKINS